MKLTGQSFIVLNTLSKPCFISKSTIHLQGTQTKICARIRTSASPITCRKTETRRCGDTSLQKLLVSQVIPWKDEPVRLYVGPSIEEVEREKAISRHRIYEFLRANGISPEDLDDMDLPVTVAVMRDRIDFLHELGLTIQDINDYPLVLGCSVKKNMIPVLDYLGRLGVEKSDLRDFLRRYPQVLHASVVVDLEPVVKHLLGMDILPVDIPKVLTRYPELLGFKVEGTLSTSVAYLVAIGVSRRKLGEVLPRYPEILGMRVGRIIKPFVEFLQTLEISRSSVARLVEEEPRIVGFDLEKRVKPNVDVLRGRGVTGPTLVSVVSRYPDILGIDLAPRLDSREKFFASTVGMNNDEYVKVIARWPRIVSLDETAMLRHLEFLKGCGICVEDMKRMVLRCPLILALKLDVMREAFDFFRSEMDGKLEDLVSFPEFFTYGLESKVKPRHCKVAERGFRCSLWWLLDCTDEKFAERMSYDIVGSENTCNEGEGKEWECGEGGDARFEDGDVWEESGESF